MYMYIGNRYQEVWYPLCWRNRVHRHAQHPLFPIIRPEEEDGFGLLSALFPGGSVTGAPKLRAMEVISELEEEGRGFFTGSMGYASLDGSAAWNILIRTMLWRPRPDVGPVNGEVSFRVGGGITWGSDAGAEDAETLIKADRLMRALEADA